MTKLLSQINIDDNPTKKFYFTQNLSFSSHFTSRLLHIKTSVLSLHKVIVAIQEMMLATGILVNAHNGSDRLFSFGLWI
jgi:hypothetical protein